MDLSLDRRPANLQAVSHRGQLAGFGLRPVWNISQQASLLVDRQCGRIVVEDGRLVAVFGRWWPYTGNILRARIDARWRWSARDCCELYYHASLFAPGFLTLSYVRSGPATSLSTFYAATLVLDEIARLKGSSAIVCHVTNRRIGERLMARWNWERHCLNWRGRHYIKRFYGTYPPIANIWRQRLGMEPAGN